MDDLVVIILTLVIAGFGLLGQIKKQKQIQQPASEDKLPPDNIWDLFNAEPVNSHQEFDAETDETEEEEAPIAAQVPSYQFKAENEGVSFGKERPASKPMERNIPAHKSEDFSLRKAVIYSEILKQKYI